MVFNDPGHCLEGPKVADAVIEARFSTGNMPRTWPVLGAIEALRTEHTTSAGRQRHLLLTRKKNGWWYS